MALSDRDALQLLGLRAEGWTFKRIGKAMGLSRNAVAGGLRRLDEADAEAHGHSEPRQSDPSDGSMGPNWLHAGLDAQETQHERT
ncbi:MAG: hypothetical protein AAFU61_12395 [Pseudomonadota bacterium]